MPSALEKLSSRIRPRMGWHLLLLLPLAGIAWPLLGRGTAQSSTSGAHQGSSRASRVMRPRSLAQTARSLQPQPFEPEANRTLEIQPASSPTSISSAPTTPRAPTTTLGTLTPQPSTTPTPSGDESSTATESPSSVPSTAPTTPATTTTTAWAPLLQTPRNRFGRSEDCAGELSYSAHRNYVIYGDLVGVLRLSSEEKCAAACFRFL